MSQPFTASLLDTSDEAAVAEYERAFYNAFVKVTSNQLIRTLWCWDTESQRLKTHIPYEHQRVYVGRDAQGVIEMAIAANTVLKHYQSSAFGFSPPNPSTGCCEFLTFFTQGNHRLAHKLHFWEGCFTDLLKNGYRTGYASSAARLLPVYKRIGGKVLAERQVESEMRYHWTFSLERYWMRSAQA
jgi:hypothetical protein